MQHTPSNLTFIHSKFYFVFKDISYLIHFKDNIIFYQGLLIYFPRLSFVKFLS